MWQGWVNFILGAWLVLSGFIPALQSPGNLGMTGLLAAIFGFWTYKDWRGDSAGILGIWAFLSSAWWNLLAPANFLVVGFLLGISGLWEGLTQPKSAAKHVL